ncbi:hypothetical protein [Magnetococcus sp. PR-3]|uniref:hypothetical protein n=1 Tax=Magnetococcus sp. PR-3 TaxID=3120355 RepID=UPI002FCE5AC8
MSSKDMNTTYSKNMKTSGRIATPMLAHCHGNETTGVAEKLASELKQTRRPTTEADISNAQSLAELCASENYSAAMTIPMQQDDTSHASTLVTDLYDIPKDLMRQTRIQD